MGLLVIGSLAMIAGYSFIHDVRFAAPASPDAPGDENGPTATGRDPLLWPFSRDSIWNLPIGSDARYVWAGIRPATSMAYFTDADILILEPNAPLTTVYANYDDWGAGNRCTAQGPAMFDVPIPTNFVVPGSHQGSPDGDTPNSATAILGADGRTIYDSQPFARCAAGAPATSHYDYGSWYGREDLYGLGETGSHGGSALSALGGTVRVGELVPGGTIRHSLKLNLDNANYYSGFSGFRWPARKSDNGGAGYTGSIPEVRMGSLLAVKPDFAITNLESEPGRIVARAFMDYGGYVVDTSGWSIYNFVTERSPDGAVQEEFETAWGYPLNAGVGANGWARDLLKIFTNLYVVDDWDQTTWQTVSASAGALGVGLGAARVPWAPDFGAPPVPTPDQIPPTTSAVASGTWGASDWYRSSVTVTLTATDAGSGVASVHVRTDGGAWNLYQTPVTISADGRHTVEYYATDRAGNNGATQTLWFGIDTIAPTTASALSGTLGGDGWYRSPVTVTLTSSDVGSGIAGVQVRADGGSWSAYGSPFTVSSEGLHTTEFRATDVAGNVETVGTASFKIDTGAPVTTHALSGTLSSTGWYLSSVNVTLDATGAGGAPVSIEYRLDGGAWVPYSSSFSVDQGRHVLHYQSTDAQGNMSLLESVPIHIDYTPPTLARSGPETIPQAGVVSWTGSDSVSGIERHEVSLDGAAFRAVGSEPSLAGPWAPGSHNVTVKAYDAAGNVATLTIPFRVDASAPSDGPVPTAPPITLPSLLSSVALLAVIGSILTAGGALYGCIRMGRANRRGRGARRSAKRSSRRGSRGTVDGPDDGEFLL